MNSIWKKLLLGRIWKRIYVERLGEPLIYNLASIFVMLFGSTRSKIEYDVMPRHASAYSILAAADHAKSYGIKRLALLEFGVAAGAGLMNMCWIAERVTKETGVEFDIIGFDSGEGMPPPRDYRDHPEHYFTGDYPPIDKAALLKALPPNAKIYYGPIEQTLKQAEREITSTIGFISIDVDYFFSTEQSLEVLTWQPERYLPAVPMYFDDVAYIDHNRFCGELLAIDAFNDTHDLRKIAPVNFLPKYRIFKNALWHGQIYYAHILDHEFRGVAYNTTKRPKIAVLTNPYLSNP
ncbi:hypothetical protein JQ633_32565 [Bradyrhizobium tropiciagri]|uniref:hypothetical protein n=1 Tax=Bradyrhizobium tropiciagri TaxID=312253 RepID=UPI001BA870FB|nr:hypothetical protein [Bradyrhizobium tropiciagri]MBR0875132.1 hypothetical protein [Bradyrhizobium tropiciagri]